MENDLNFKTLFLRNIHPCITTTENDKLTLEQPAQGINKIIHKDSKLTKLKLNPHKNKDPHISTHKSWWKWWWKFFQRKEEDRKWKKKEKPDSAWLTAGQEGSDQLTQPATEYSTTSPHSQRISHQPEAIQNTEAKTVYHMLLSTAAFLTVPGRQSWPPPRASALVHLWTNDGTTNISVTTSSLSQTCRMTSTLERI